MTELRRRAARSPKRIVFTEPGADRVLRAAARLGREGLAHPVLLGDPGELRARAARLGLSLARLAFVRPEARRDYLSLWHARWAPRGVREAEAAASLDSPLAFARVMVRAGDADAILAGPHARDNVLAALPGGRLRFFIVRARLVAEPSGMAAPSSGELAGIAIRAAAVAAFLKGSPPHVVFVAPGVQASLGRRARFSTAREEIEARTEEAIRTVRARADDLVVADRLEVDLRWVFDRSDADACGVLTHSGGGNARAWIGRLMDGSPVLGPVHTGPEGTWGEVSEGSDEEEIIDLAVLTALAAPRTGGSL